MSEVCNNELYNMISEEDRNKIVEWIECFAGHGGDNAPELKADLSHILRFWSNNKTNLFQIFGKELILSKDIRINMPDEMIDDEINTHLYDYTSECYKFISDIYQLGSKFYQVQNLVSYRDLRHNIYLGDEFTIPNPKGNIPIKVCKGCKTSKILGKIASAYDLRNYEEFRIEHSKILNNKTLYGELCLSIHPLDYMTMSDNDCDWSSCMSWARGGDYRQGTVEMMNSPYIVVAYLKSSTDMTFLESKTTWNNKKWRELFVVSPEIIMGIRQYPYTADEIQGITLNWLKELTMRNTTWGMYTHNACEISNNIRYEQAELNKSVLTRFDMEVMYNDIDCNHLAYLNMNAPDSILMNLSGESECMCCGEEFDGYDDTSSLLCPTCENVVVCVECGCKVSVDDAQWYGDYAFCPYCYKSSVKICPCCGELYYVEEGEVLYAKQGDSLNSFAYICSSCFNELQENSINYETDGKDNQLVKLLGKMEKSTDGLYPWMAKSYVDTKNFTSDEAWEVFWEPEVIEKCKQKAV